jgi:ribose transport system substrate-binding protein
MTRRYHLAASVLALGMGAGLAAHADEAAMAAAQAILDEHRAMPTFAPPGEPFDAKACMADKSVLSIPVTMQVPFVEALEGAMARAASEVGFKYTLWENPGSFDAWVQGVAQAIAQKYSLVDMAGGLNPELLGPQLSEARTAGLKITTSHLYDESQKVFDGTDGNAKIPYRQAGEILAAWAYVETKGAPNVLIIGSDDVLPTGPFVESIQAKLKEFCPECKQKYVNVPLADWGTKIQSETQSAILADPTINYILPIYDSMSQFVIPGLQIAGAPDVPIASFNGTPFILDMVREGKVAMTIGESLGWAGYASVDAMMRTMCGLPVPEQLGIPLLIFDKTNISTVSTPADFDSGYGDAHIAGYHKLWMME